MSRTSSSWRGRRTPAQPLGQRPVAAVDHAEGAGDGGRDEGGVGQRREVDEDHAVGEVVRDIVGDGEGEAGLADAAGTGQRQQRHRLVEQQGAGGGHLPLPADERGARERQRWGTIGERRG